MRGRNNTSTLPRLSTALVVLLLLLVFPLLLPGQDLFNPFLEEEAPEALFESEIGDTEVDLFVLGSWTSGWGTSFGIALHPPLPGSRERTTFPYPFPGFERRSFYQFVDLTLSLWLFERYFFETTFRDGFEFNSLLLGYQGREGEPVQYVLAGNSTLPFSEYPYLETGDATQNVPGLAARFDSDRTSHELLVRLESTVPDSLLFQGLNALTETRIEPINPIRGRFFVLPDGDIDDLILYIEDEDGSVLETGSESFRRRRYRRLDLDAESVYSLGEGTVILREPAEGRVLVYYEKGGVPVGDPALGAQALVADDPVSGNPTDGYEDFSFRSETYYGKALSEYAAELSDGNRTLLLYAPGAYNPFEQLNRYETDGVTPEQAIELVERGTSEPATRFEDLTVSPEREGAYLTVSTGAASPRDVGNRYPFARVDPDSGVLPRETRIYGPGALTEPAAASVQILTQQLNEVDAIRIDEETVPGTVTVLRNGVPVTGAAIDYESGEVALPGRVVPGDRIELRFRRYTEEQRQGDLLFASGNRIDLSDYLTATVALGGRWNISDTEFSSEQGENPGSVTLSGALDYEAEDLQARVDGAVQLYQPDTTGFFRVDGMDNEVQELTVTPERLLPAAPPRPSRLDEEREDGSDGSAVAALDGLTRENRGILRYRDYTDTPAGGGEIVREYDASLSPEKSYPYQAGSRRGPYTASAASDGISGRVAVADFELSGGEWEAIKLAPGGTLDLRNTPEVTFSYSLRPTVDGEVPDRNIEVWLQLGYLSEDTDGDGILDSGDSGVQPLYPFDDPARGITLFAGDARQGYGRPLTEDVNGNGLLDRGSTEQFISLPLATSSDDLPVDRWQEVTLELSAEERSRLGRTTAVSVVIRERDGSDARGRLLVSSVELFGSGYLGESDDPAASVSVREGPDPLTGEQALSSRESRVRELFLRDGAVQRVLKLSWSDLAPGGYARAFRPTPPLFLEEYGTLVFYAYLEDAEGTPDAPELTLTLSEAPPTADAGAPPGASLSAVIEMSSPPGSALSDGWSEVAVDTRSGEIRINGVPAGRAQRSGSALRELRYTTVEVTGSEEGTVYIDEIHLADPQVRLDGAGSARVSWQRPGEILTAGETVLLRDFEITQGLTLRSRQFSAAGQTVGTAGTFVSSTGAGITASILRVEGEATAAVTDSEVSGEGGHALALPAGDSPILLEDTFRRSFEAQIPLLGRSNSLLLSSEALGSHQIRSEAELERQRLRQEWSLSSETPGSRTVALATELRAYQNASGYNLEETDYATSWIRSYPLLLRWDEGLQEERRGEGELTLSLTRQPWQLRLEPRGDYQRLPSRELRSSAAVRLTTERTGSFEEGPAWSVAPYYERGITAGESDVRTPDFREDLSLYGDQIVEMSYPYRAIPGAELFTPLGESGFAAESRRFVEAGYRPVAGVVVDRPFGSRITDLYTPSDLEFSLARSYLREEASLLDEQEWSLATTAAAINLFGRQGAYRRFDIYLSDEIRNTLNATIVREITASEVSQSYSLETKLALFGESERALDYRQLLATEIAEETSYTVESETSYTWTTIPRSILGIRRLDSLITEQEAFYRHTLRGSAVWESESAWDLRFVLGHESALEIPETGEIRLYLDLGWINEPFSEGSDQRQQILGALLGVEGTLQF